jgi:hypothetical protein
VEAHSTHQFGGPTAASETGTSSFNFMIAVPEPVSLAAILIPFTMMRRPGRRLAKSTTP